MMKTKILATVLSACEKIIAYFALLIVVILQIINLVDKSMLNINSTDLSLCLISSSLLVIFQHIEDIKKAFNKSSKTVLSDRFNDGLMEIFKKHSRIKSLDIMAHTTRTYIHSIADNDITVDRVRILVCRPKNSNARQYPDEDSVEYLDSSRDQAIERWRDLVETGRIRHLEIRYFEFDPTFHFAIINNQYLHYGLYKMEHKNPGYHLFTLYTLDGAENHFALNQLTDYKEFFNHVFEKFSYDKPVS